MPVFPGFGEPDRSFLAGFPQGCPPWADLSGKQLLVLGVDGCASPGSLPHAALGPLVRSVTKGSAGSISPAAGQDVSFLHGSACHVDQANVRADTK